MCARVCTMYVRRTFRILIRDSIRKIYSVIVDLAKHVIINAMRCFY